MRVCVLGVMVWDYRTMKMTLPDCTTKMTVLKIVSCLKDIVHWQVVPTTLFLGFSALLGFLRLRAFSSLLF